MSSRSDDLVVVQTFSDRVEADLARTALEAAGIEAMVRSDDAEGLQPGLTFSNGAQLIVRAADAESARDVLGGAARPHE